MSEFGVLPETYRVDQSGDWAEYVSLITQQSPLVLDNLTGATAEVTLIGPGGSVPITTVITQPNIVAWSATEEHLSVATPGPYTLKVKITRASGFRQIVLRGNVVLVP